jgi:L-asparagine oxygenase
VSGKTVPVMASTALRETKEDLVANGYHFDSRYHTIEEVQALAESLGTLRYDIRHKEIVRSVSPTAVRSAHPNTLSSRYGLDLFPLHTETAYWRTPCRYLALRCEHPGSGGRRTTVMPIGALKFTRLQRSLLEAGVWVAGDRRPFLCSLFEDGFVRFDRDCMKPISAKAIESEIVLRHQIERHDVRSIEWIVGAVLIVDNYVCLHGRGLALAPDPDRVLQRILIK